MIRETRLAEVVASMKNGIYKPASEYADDGMPCLRMYNIDAGSIVWRDIKRMRISSREFSEYGLHEGDLLVNRVNSRELVGKSACITAAMEASVFESKNIRVRLDRSKVLPKFINYQLLARGSRHFANNAQQVVGMASISQGQLGDFPIVMTDLNDQHRIVAEIEKQFSRLDEAIANLKRVKANLKRYKAAVLKAAVEGRLVPTEAELARKDGRTYETGERLLQSILETRRRDWKGKGKYKEPDSPETEDAPHAPDGWTWSCFDLALTTIEAGASFKCVERPPLGNETGVLKVSAVSWGEFDEEESKTCTDHTRLEDSYLVESGNFLFSRANTIELVGACVIVRAVTKRLMLSDKTLRFSVVSLIPQEWLLILLRSKFGRQEIERLASGNQDSMRNIGQERIRQIRLPIPPLSEISRITAEVERCMSLVQAVEVETDAILKRAEVLRQSILSKSFSES